MADYKATTSEFQTVANAIRTKGGTSASLAWPDGFASAIEAIPSGITPSGSISISQNGTYNVEAFAQAVVSVSGGGGGSNDNFKIAIGAMSGSVYDTEAASILTSAFYINNKLLGIEMTALQDIRSWAFYSAQMLSVASFPECLTIGSSAFYYCTSLTSIFAPKVTTIYGHAFNACYALQAVIMPSLQYIHSNAFTNCSSLSNIVAENCSIISNSAFNNCSNLLTVNLPTCSVIDSNAFKGCRKLESLYLLSASVVSLGQSVFTSTPMVVSSYLGHFGSVFVPGSLVDEYKVATNWSSIADRITAYVA